MLFRSELLLNEAFISGESDAVFKHQNDEILAASFVIGGQAKCRVIRVNTDNYINKILLSINSIKNQPSELKRALNLIIKTISFIIIPLGLIIFLKQYFLGNITIDEALIQTVASMIGMIPEGLILLTSVALSVGSVKLSANNTLVQDLYSLEMMARTDVLCLDKTGTITNGKMYVDKIVKFKEFDEAIIASIINSLNDSNQTAKALREYYKDFDKLKIDKLIHFNPNNKYSGGYYNDSKYLIGAYEYVCDDLNNEEKTIIEKYADEGYRVITFSQDRNLLAICLIKDHIRDNAKDIIDYLYKQDVKIKIISGDNPNTLKNIAKQIKLNDIKILDCSAITDLELTNNIEEYNIFARVSPKQKQVIVKAYQELGHTVGMMGDGVNDVMALKDADFSISVISAVESARNVANVILMDDDFGHIPNIINEGRRVINNIQRTSTLFLIKTCLSVSLTILTIFIFKEYPFAPIQLTLISSVGIGIPSFILSLEPKYGIISGNFLDNILKRAVPSALAISCSAIILEILIAFNVISRDSLSSICSTITAIIVIFNIFQISKPNNLVSKSLIAFAIIAYFTAFSFFKSIFYFVDLNWTSTIITVILSITALTILKFLSNKELSTKLVNKINQWH